MLSLFVRKQPTGQQHLSSPKIALQLMDLDALAQDIHLLCTSSTQDIHIHLCLDRGEHKVERAKAQSKQELQRLLGNLAALPATAPADLSANGISSLGASSDTTRSAHRKTRIERAASRDPVGDQVPAGNALKCTFSGVLSIAPQHFLDSGISRVECASMCCDALLGASR